MFIIWNCSSFGIIFLSPTESYSLCLTILLRYYGHTKIVKGRARHPESQGAVERGNAPFKEALQKWMQDNNTTSWAVLGCYVTQAQINKRPSRAKGNFSPYEAFFGQVPKSAPQNYLSQELLSLCESDYGSLLPDCTWSVSLLLLLGHSGKRLAKDNIYTPMM